MVTKMTHNTGSLLLHEARPNRVPPEEQDVIVKWLTKVRGPNAKDMDYHLLPGPRGPATKVVITQYELPRLLTAPFFFQAEDGIRDADVTGVQTCALPISGVPGRPADVHGRRAEAVRAGRQHTTARAAGTEAGRRHPGADPGGRRRPLRGPAEQIGRASCRERV